MSGTGGGPAFREACRMSQFNLKRGEIWKSGSAQRYTSSFSKQQSGAYAFTMPLDSSHCEPTPCIAIAHPPHLRRSAVPTPPRSHGSR